MADGKVKVTSDLLVRVLAREEKATREFVHIVGPILHVSLARLFLRRGFDGQTSRDQAREACQEVYRVFLLEDRGSRARKWDPDRGSFEHYIGLFANDFISGKLRKTTEVPLPGAGDTTEIIVDDRSTTDEIVGSREIVSKVVHRLLEELEELGREMFQLLFVEHREVDEVCEQMGMTHDAVYQWRSRLVRRMRAIALDLEGAE